MARFVAKHLVFLLLTLFVVSFLVFALNEFSPGAVARKELGAYATEEQVDLLTRQLGLDRPQQQPLGVLGADAPLRELHVDDRNSDVRLGFLGDRHIGQKAGAQQKNQRGDGEPRVTDGIVDES